MNGRRRDLAPLLVFLAAAAYFLAGALGHDLWETGEHRYAEVARVLCAPGGDHVVPHLNGAIYPDKPPVFFWLAGAGHALGLDLPLSAKLPSILGGALVVMLTFLLGRRFYGTAAGLVAAGVLATTELFDYASRTVHLDVPVALVTTTTLYCFVRADATPLAERARRAAWSAAGFLVVGVGIVLKGPPAPLVPAVTIAAVLLWTSPRGLQTPTLAWGALLALLPGIAWAAAVVADLGWEVGAKQYLWGDLLHGQAIAHAAGEIDKQQPWTFYAWNVPAYLLPWTAFLATAAWAALKFGRETEKRADRFVVAWLVAPWVVFSFSVAKRNLYLVPIHPAAALLVARLVRDAAESPERLRHWATNVPRRAFAGAAVVFGAALLVALVFLKSGATPPGGLAERAEQIAELRDALTASRLLVAAAFGVGLAAAGVVAWRTTSAWKMAAALVAATGAYHLLDGLVLARIRDADESPRAFLADVRAKIGDAPIARVGGDGGLQYAVNWVLERDVVPELWIARKDGLDVAATRAKVASFLDSTSPRYVVALANEWKKLGVAPGIVEVLRAPRRHEGDRLLIGNAAANR